jgi:hypothetical protein
VEGFTFLEAHSHCVVLVFITSRTREGYEVDRKGCYEGDEADWEDSYDYVRFSQQARTKSSKPDTKPPIPQKRGPKRKEENYKNGGRKFFGARHR